MAWATVRAAMDHVAEHGTNGTGVAFTGGEPLLAFPMLVRAVVYAEQRLRAAGWKPRWRIVTNGTLLDDRALRFLERHDVMLQLSFDGIAEAQSLRGRRTFQTLDRLLNRLRAQYARVFERRLQVGLTLSVDAVPYLAESVAYLIGKGVKTLRISPAMGEMAWKVEWIEELKRQFARMSATVLAHYERTGTVPLTVFRKTRPDHSPPERELICLAGNPESLAIDVDGQVYGCVLAVASYRNSPPAVLRPAMDALHVGGIQDEHFADRAAQLQIVARRSGAFRQPKRRYSSYGCCAECVALGRCQVCPLAAGPLPDWPDARRVPDFLCAFNRVSLEYRDRFQCQPGVREILAGHVPLPTLLA
jgi:sulfatase maturation enzyme AslB (radical SAM superfamily)